jgi:hypothetical protein
MLQTINPSATPNKIEWPFNWYIIMLIYVTKTLLPTNRFSFNHLFQSQTLRGRGLKIQKIRYECINSDLRFVVETI